MMITDGTYNAIFDKSQRQKIERLHLKERRIPCSFLHRGVDFRLTRPWSKSTGKPRFDLRIAPARSAARDVNILTHVVGVPLDTILLPVFLGIHPDSPCLTQNFILTHQRP